MSARPSSGQRVSSLAMTCGIAIRTVWTDDDLHELRVSAGNGTFAGAANVYVTHEEFDQIAQAIEGFPGSIRDRRVVELGTFDRNIAGGGVRLTLHCVDGIGHAALEVEICSKSSIQGEGTASFSIPFEPAALDRFVGMLQRLKMDASAEAMLDGRCS